MSCCQHRQWIVQFATAAFLLGGSSAFGRDGPSFDCSHGVRQTLAVILCSFPEAAEADWDLNRAYWALFTDNREETTFNEAVNRRCTLPPLITEQERAGRVFIQELGRRMLGSPLPIPTPQPVTERHVRCVISAFHDRAADLRGRLKGDALAESNLSPDEHIDIQLALIRKGLLQDRIRGYGPNADGQFGPNTRAAIKDFQRSTGEPPTGFLSRKQQMALIESPEEREARDKAKRDAIEAQKRAEEQAKLAEAKAKQDAIDREKKRLEDEAAKATEWRQKIDEAEKKGAEYAAKWAALKWVLDERTNPMTDEKDYTVAATQSNGTGALAAIDGRCLNDEVQFRATLHDAKDQKVPLGFPPSSLGSIIGKKRINDDSAFATNFPLDKWRNRIVISRLSFRDDDAESADTTWRVMAEIETSQGTLYIRIPTFDSNIQKLITSCKQQYEVEKRRQGLPDVPGN